MFYSLNNLLDIFEYSTSYPKNIIQKDLAGTHNLMPVIFSSNLIKQHILLDILNMGYKPVLFDPLSLNLFSDLVSEFKFDYIFTENEFISDLEKLKLKSEIITKNELAKIKQYPASNQLYFLTSGSTGKAKLVEKTIHKLLSEANVLKNLFEINQSALVLSSVPLCHIYGFLFSYLTPSIVKAPVINLENLSQLIKELKENKATIWITVPSVINALIPLISKDLSTSLRLIVSSGAKLSKESAEKISELTGSKVIEVYGSTETGGIATLETVNSNSYQLLPEVRIFISTTGNILVKSPFVSENTLSADGQQFLLDNNGYYQTNDLGYLESDNLYLEGRSDRIVKIRSKRISLDLVEKSLLGLSFIDDICVISNEDKNEPDLVAFVRLNNPIEDFLIKSEAQNLIPDFMLPKHFIKVENFPRFPNGKINYKLLKDQFLETRA